MSTINKNSNQVTGDYVTLDGEQMYCIANSHLMNDFFMSLVSSSDHWMFVSSAGWLTAGRRDPDLALFPYYSEDKLADTRDSTGSLTLLRVCQDFDNETIWQPFSKGLDPRFSLTRNLYKSPLGNRVVFEEVNQTLGLKFRYSWRLSNRFGFVRDCHLENFGSQEISLELLDGIQNVLPCGTDRDFQLRFSNLGDAYKKSELLEATRLAIYYLSSIPTDKAEPSEGLKATAIWSLGLDEANVVLGTEQISRFRAGQGVYTESDLRGKRGAYLLSQKVELQPNSPRNWRMVASLGQTQSQIVNLNQVLQGGTQTFSPIAAELDADIASSHNELLKIVSATDGVQFGRDPLRINRHQSNVVYNSMRGGFPVAHYRVPTEDFREHVKQFNKAVFEANRTALEGLADEVEFCELISVVQASGDVDLLRIGAEYLPLTFSRRHGDPSRPWNAFLIEVQTEHGEKRLGYQGNWRDLFQNWEALGVSFPGFVRNMIFRFVNASTADGYNPYRVTKDGFDWEVPEPDDPWANIGYWSDHQIIYLLKLLELSRSYDPQVLDQWLDQSCFVYANVPYRIRSYEAIKKHPRETIDYDREAHARIMERVDRQGADGKLLRRNSSDEIYHVSLIEKLLVPALAKMTNFVPGGGIWLNTQRPEWNDANNALVGAGVSVVTVCYLRRWFAFMKDWFSQLDTKSFEISIEISELLEQVAQTLVLHQSRLADRDISNELRKEIVDGLSNAGSSFRYGLYDTGLSGKTSSLSLDRCLEFFDVCLEYLDHTIKSNRRSDGLYHAYNLLAFDASGVRVDYLYEMLEGQVAVLSSGTLNASEAVEVLAALRKSQMYREDQGSYMLYPNRQLPRFLEKNIVPEAAVNGSKLLSKLLEQNDESIVVKDPSGYRFNSEFRNVSYLQQQLEQLAAAKPELAELVESESQSLGELFVEVFGHDKFTGRSGTFFGYEGLGSIYWHMVSKLALAAQESLLRAIDTGASADVVATLDAHYREIRDGIGLIKSPAHYGGFPTDPYSHSPEFSGVRQPGMTGQVKEDILTRMCEIGVRAADGIIGFDGTLFDRAELVEQPATFKFYDLQEKLVELSLESRSFAFLVCQVPVVYREAENNLGITIHFEDGSREDRKETVLSRDETQSLIHRQGKIIRIDVRLTPLI